MIPSICPMMTMDVLGSSWARISKLMKANNMLNIIVIIEWLELFLIPMIVSIGGRLRYCANTSSNFVLVEAPRNSL